MCKLGLTALAWASSLTPFVKKQLHGFPHDLIKLYVESSGPPPALYFLGLIVKPQCL